MKELPCYSKIIADEGHFESSRTIMFLYTLFCLAIATVIFILAICTVEISISSPGFIRPSSEIGIIRAVASGRIRESFLTENQWVQNGDTLYSIESESLDIKEKYVLGKLHEVNDLIEDLLILTTGHVKVSELQTHVLRQAWLTYLQRLKDAEIRYEKIKKDYSRYNKLHAEKVIADAEFETHKFELDHVRNEVVLLTRTQMSQWQNELNNYEKDAMNLESELKQINEEKKTLTMRSPLTGTVQNLAGIYPGSIVYANQELAQISPDSGLMVEAYVSPNDIGLLRHNMKVKFQINAFNHNQWGLVEGTIMDISSDIQSINDKPVFVVRCVLGRNYLQLKNGYRGILKKGMTLQARFVVTERTLWQLLYDKMDDWLNPNAYKM
jgi:multidrug resistance efflux pump